MAMTIMNNTSSMLTLGQLNKNISKIGKELKKVSSGMKLNSAGDDASAFAISEKMRVRIRGLEQDIENVKKGKSLLEVGAGGIDEIVQELRNLKALSINAANDHNSDKDRTIIQKEFDQRMENIDDIASTTNYNGIYLLNGDWERYRYKTIVDDNTSNPHEGGDVSTDVTEPTGEAVQLTGSDVTISEAGVYILESNMTVNIEPGLTGVKFVQQQAELQSVYINGPSSGNANVWLEGLNIRNSDDSSWIRFYGSDNVLSLKGNNCFNNDYFYDYDYNYKLLRYATINMGDGLTIEGDGRLEITVKSTDGAMIGTDVNQSTSGSLTINSGTYYLTNALGTRENPIWFGGAGAVIGSGINSSIGDININGGSFDIFSIGGAAAIGSAEGQDPTGKYISQNISSVSSITIRNASITAVTDDGACIGSGGEKADVGDVLIENSILNLECKRLWTRGSNNVSQNQIKYNQGAGAAIGSGYRESNAGDITIRNSTVNAASKWGAGVGSGSESHAGNITIENMTGTITVDNGAEEIGKGFRGTVGDVTIIGGGAEPTPPVNRVRVQGKPLVIHTGTKANQALRCYIPNMHTSNMGVDGVSVVTREKAEASLDKLDKALEYTLDAATQIGCYIQELDACEENLVTNNENTRASESVIRDADMAKSMMEYTKANVLSQASQSMLAQANQTSASVLSLLQ